MRDRIRRRSFHRGLDRDRGSGRVDHRRYHRVLCWRQYVASIVDDIHNCQNETWVRCRGGNRELCRHLDRDVCREYRARDVHSRLPGRCRNRTCSYLVMISAIHRTRGKKDVHSHVENENANVLRGTERMRDRIRRRSFRWNLDRDRDSGRVDGRRYHHVRYWRQYVARNGEDTHNCPIGGLWVQDRREIRVRRLLDLDNCREYRARDVHSRFHGR